MTTQQTSGATVQRGLWSLDVVRGVSAQLVLIGHGINVILPQLFMHPGPRGLLEARLGFFYMQNFAVMLFFYVSGYLITSSFMAKTQRPDWGLGPFLIDRFARIFTALIPLILVLAIVDRNLPEGTARIYEMGTAHAADVIRALTMSYDHPLLNTAARALDRPALAGGALGSAPQLWTVVIEWWIYVVFGCAAMLLTGGRRGLVIRITLLTFALPVVVAALRSHPILPLAWIVGMSARIAERRLTSISPAWLLGAGAGGTVAGLWRLADARWNAYDIGFGLAIALPLFAAVAAERAGIIHRPTLPFVRRPVAFMADVSYTLYLVHLPILFHVALAVPALVGEPAALVALFFLCNFAAWIFFLLFDRHHHRMAGAIKRRFDGSHYTSSARHHIG